MHLDKLPSVISRYRNEVRRVLSVLNTALEGKRYLVGDKVTIADLSFVPWHSIIPVRLLTPYLPHSSTQALVQFNNTASEFLANLMDTVHLHGRHGSGDERISERGSVDGRPDGEGFCEDCSGREENSTVKATVSPDM